MSLNEIQLPALVTSGLYKNSLVIIKDLNETKDTAIEHSYKFLGKNKKNIVLVAHSSDAVFVTEAHLTFITKLLGACKMNLEDIAILNSSTEQIIITELKKQLSPKTLILFGVEPPAIKLPIHFPMFKLQEYGGCVYLFAPALEELNQDTNEGKLLKSKLWICLQKLFEL
jgi:hypothetical protein